MKFLFSEMAFFLAQQRNRRNLRLMSRFALFTLLLIALYSILFHALMGQEGRDFSPVTGLYWTLTVMSTLGFGDITFTSDLGKLFTILVLFSGIVLFVVIMPFAFIRFVYAPWLEAQTQAVTPRELPEGTAHHVVVVGADAVTISVVDRLRQYNLPYALLCDNNDLALELYDRHYKVVLGELDSSASYEAMRVRTAALVVALHDDLKNTNIAATVREVAGHVPMAASITNVDSYDVLHLAGCDYVFHFSRMLGKTLARRVFNAAMQSNIVGRYAGLCIAEAPVQHTSLVGKTVLESDLLGRFGLNVAGIWQGNTYMPAGPDTVFEENAVLLLAGTADQLELYDRSMSPEWDEIQPPVLILGGGRVGKAVAEDLESRNIPFFLVEKNSAAIPQGDPRYVHGNAADHETLRRAGIETTQTVVVTTHNDDLNIYLSIYCRKLRPDVQIISRATLDRNVAALYNAGASLVLSQAGMTATTVVNLLVPGRVFMLTEGLNIFKVRMPRKLVGQTLLNSGLRRATQCNVVALRSRGEMSIPPDPRLPLEADDELILIGTAEAEKKFMHAYPDKR